MKIKNIGLFATPESMDALNFNLEQLSGGERVAGSLMMGLTWNYLASQVNGPEPEPITIVFGEYASSLHSDGENDLDRLGEYGVVETFTFDTEAEKTAFLQALDYMDGWLGYTPWQDE